MEPQKQPLDERAQAIADLFALVEYLAERPDVPLGSAAGLLTYPILCDDDVAGMARLREIADLLGEPITDVEGREPAEGETHFFARKTFGRAWYSAHYILRAEMLREES